MKKILLLASMFICACGGATTRYNFIPILPTNTTSTNGVESSESPGFLCEANHSRNDFRGCHFVVFHYSQSSRN